MAKRKTIALATEWSKSAHAAVVAALTPNAKTIAVIVEGIANYPHQPSQQTNAQPVAYE